ncbi:N-succinylarginine dihydrolase 2, partial [Friedmanniomyces endolithicus]
TLEASQAVARRHGVTNAFFTPQARAAIDAGVFHNDVVCVGAKTCLFYHEASFEEGDAVERLAKACEPLFSLQPVRVASADLPLGDAISSYLFNSMLIQVPGEDRLTLICPTETRDNPRSHAVAQGLISSNGPIGRVDYVDVRQSMRNGGGPACLRLRVVLTDAELSATNQNMRLTDELHGALSVWGATWYRDRLSPADLADPLFLDECRGALDELTQILALGGGFYPFQRP